MRATKIFALILTLSASARAEPLGDKSTPRFQIIAAPYDITGEDHVMVTRKTVFKIDTVTGETWVFFAFAKGGEPIQGWVPITEFPEASRARASKGR